MRKLALAGGTILAALLALIVVSVSGQTQQNAAALTAAALTSCGANDVTSGTAGNTPYTGPLPDPSRPTFISVVPLTGGLQQTYIAAAATVPQVPWPVLAGIGNVESGQGRNLGPSSAGAVGWMQFLLSTWNLTDPNDPEHRPFGRDGDPNNPADAIPAAGRLLVASGADGTADGLRAAIFAYNHSTVYVDTVLAAAKVYAAGGSVPGTPAPAAGAPLACVPQNAGSPGSLSAQGCVSPLTRYTITGRYGESRPGHLHAGLDLAAPAGTPIYSPCAGTVTFAASTGGYGNYICVAHTATLTTCHGHESRILVAVGQHVQAGTVIGLVGGIGQGDATGDHDHFEIRSGLWGATSDPVPWLRQNTLPVPRTSTGQPSD